MTADIVRGLQAGNDLKPIGNASPMVVACMRGWSVILESTSPFVDARGQSQKERVWPVTIPRQDGSSICSRSTGIRVQLLSTYVLEDAEQREILKTPLPGRIRHAARRHACSLTSAVIFWIATFPLIVHLCI